MGWLPTSLVEHAALVPVGVLVVVLVSGALGWVGREDPRVLTWFLVLAGVGVLGVTLAPEDRGRVREITCEAGFGLPSWGSGELLADIVLFVPPTVVAVVLFRRPLHVGVGGILLSAAVEGTRALAVPLGRSCTTSDWAMNSVGTVLGRARGGRAGPEAG